MTPISSNSPSPGTAPATGITPEEASQQNVIGADTLVIGIERDETELAPRGDTVIQPDDIVTVLSRGGADTDALELLRPQPPESSKRFVR